MRILIIGGTRFLGRHVANQLAKIGHDLTLLSRRPGFAPEGANQICAERAEGIEMLQGRVFDLVLDFICYDSDAMDQLVDKIVVDRYVLISTTWLPRLWSGINADELVSDIKLVANKLPCNTLQYLHGKHRAELNLSKLRRLGWRAVSLRLPIMLGEGDHTGRFDFYFHRLVDGGPLMLVNGGNNDAQIAEVEDLANVITTWSTNKDISCYNVWEALPGEGRSIRSIIESIASTLGVKPLLVDVPLIELDQHLPSYLENEPFWRETALALTKANIYKAVGVIPKTFGIDLRMPICINASIDNLRLDELMFLEERVRQKSVLRQSSEYNIS